MLPCCWIRCCNSARPIALYWRQVHLMTAMQAQACFNQPLVLPTLWSAAPVFGGTRLRLPQRLSPQEPAAVQGRRKGLDGGARGLDVVGIGIGVAGAGGSGFGHGCSLGFLEDVLVESGERVVEFCQKRVRRHGIKFLENGCLVLNNRSLVEICQVFGRDYVQSVFERPTMIAVHWYENVWQCTKHLTIEIMDFPQNNITLCSVDWKIQLKLSSNQQKFTWRSIKNWIMIRGRKISCNNGFVVNLHVAV